MAKSAVKSFFFAFIGVPVFLLIIILCVLNAHDVEFMWSPFNALVSLPLFAILLSGFAGGFVIGWLLSHLEEK